jgi:hypothetical protein
MPHPLFTLISQNTETASGSPGIASGTSLAECSPVAEMPPQKSRGDAEGVGGGDGAGVVAVAAGVVGVVGVAVSSQAPDPSNPWQPAAGLSILAVLDPPGTDGQPGQARFTPGLTLAERREIMLDDEWFAVRIRRRAAAAEVAEGENENKNETATTKGT